MANQYVKTDSFRQKIVNKRVDPAYQNLQELLTDFRPLVTEDNQVIQWYVILNECIYNEDISDFSIKYTSGDQEVPLTINVDYTVEPTAAVVTFERGLNPQTLNNLTAYYKGGGSIIWAEDVTDLQKVISTMDTNTVYTNGSNPMTSDFFMGSGTSENPYHSIKNVNTVDGIKLNRHNHTGVQTSGVDIGKDYGVQIPTAGIENSAIIESKIATNAVTNPKIKASSVTNVKIADNTITANKFDAIMIGNGLKRVPTAIDNISVNNAVLQTNIDNSTITYNNGAMQVPGIINLTGVVLPFAGSGTSVPVGWLLCDGSSYSVTQYSRLFSVIGYTYGGSGSTFKVPDFVGKTFWGGVDNDGIENQEIAAGIPNIKGEHSLKGNYAYRGNTTTVGAFQLGSYTGKTRTAGDSSSNYDVYRMAFDASNGEIHKDLNDNEIYRNDVYGKSETVQPPAIRMKFIIKT